jgi:hypothetical protein
VAPNQSVTHIERWSLHRNIAVREFSDSEFDRVLLPLLK